MTRDATHLIFKSMNAATTKTRKPRMTAAEKAAHAFLQTFIDKGFRGYVTVSHDGCHVQVQADAARADELHKLVKASGFKTEQHFHGCWTMLHSTSHMMVPPTRRPFC